MGVGNKHTIQRYFSILFGLGLMLAIILLTLATGVSGVDGTSLQFTNLEIRAEKCDVDGKLYFTAENKYLKPLLLKDLSIEGWHEDERTREDQEKIKFYPTAGT